jgi:hypothetical protein
MTNTRKIADSRLLARVCRLHEAREVVELTIVDLQREHARVFRQIVRLRAVASELRADLDVAIDEVVAAATAADDVRDRDDLGAGGPRTRRASSSGRS